MGSGYLLVQASCFAQAPHLTSTPCLSLSSFCALLELEPQHFHDYVGVLTIVLSASGLAVEDAVVVVSVVILWPVVTVAVLCHVVAVAPSAELVLISVVGGCCPVNVVVLVVVHVRFSSLDPLYQITSSLLACISQHVIPFKLVLSQT